MKVWEVILVDLSVPLVGSVGLLGNLATIVVLSQPDMKSTFHQSLISLAVFEILYLLSLICEHVVDSRTAMFLYPLKNILLSCESYLLMSIALERLMAVVRPLWYRTARLRLSSWYHALVFILPTLFISVSLNIPRFLELELVYVNVTDTDNITREVRSFEVTPLRLDPDYIEYYIFWTRSLGTGVIPILFLLITNTTIYLSLKRQRPSTNRRSLVSSARTLSAIVVMYVVCNLPRLLLNTAEYLYQDQLYQDYSDCRCVRSVVWIQAWVYILPRNPDFF